MTTYAIPSFSPAISESTLRKVIDNSLSQLPGNLSFDKILQLRDDNLSLEEQVAQLTQKLRKQRKSAPVELVQATECGTGTLAMKPANEVFGNQFNTIEIPTYTWSEPHARVASDEDYFIDDEEVYSIQFILSGISMGLNSYIYGPTGCGKDAAINYVSHKTGLPIYRISCDADISRAELIGRDKLEGDGKGGTRSTLIEGILVKALKNPGLLVLDEIDFMREDISYVLQTVLNEGQLTLLENGGEVITKHPNCYIIATANTNGFSDIENLYPGSRQQSAAFLDRFNNWYKASYKNTYMKVLSGITGLTKQNNKSLNEFILDYHRSFNNGDIRTPLSNRAIITIAEKISQISKADENDIRDAVETTLIARLDDVEAPRVTELLNKRFL